MNIQEHAREENTAKRQEEKHLQDTMTSRAEAEIQKGADKSTDKKARDGATKQRLHEEHLRETMSTRAEAEISDRPQ